MAYTKEFDKLFCLYGKKYRLPKLLLKAVAITESALDPKAHRFEIGFWNLYMKGRPEWEGADMYEVSASYGLCQLMYVVAMELGFKGKPEELYNPVYNIELCAKLIRKHIDAVHKRNYQSKWSDQELAVGRYNGGGGRNPLPSGEFRSKRIEKHVKRFIKHYADLRKEEKECDD